MKFFIQVTARFGIKWPGNSRDEARIAATRLGLAAVPILELLTLTPAGPLPGGEDRAGIWTSYSNYLGNTTTGIYYVREYQQHSTRWPATGVPVGYFLDNLNSPFMVLYNFLPAGSEARGDGILIRTQKPVSSNSLTWFTGK